MKTAFAQSARQIVAAQPAESASAARTAELAAQACERVGNHLARLLGESGVQLLVKRSIVIASAQFPWLTAGDNPQTAVAAMRGAMEQQEPELIGDAFVAVLTAFVGLLERLIGPGLVERLLEEVWPGVFTDAAKDTL
ncbi:MAG TPA: hypothetical protein VL326_06735 [Kofleriaceae bacterium]|nr:hypothetical protein [Kofleriaceae bacterium]